MKEFTLSVNGEEYDVSANTLEEAKGYLLKSLQGDKAVSALEQSRATGSQSPTANQVPAQPERLQAFGQDVFPTSPQDALVGLGKNAGVAARGVVSGVASPITGLADFPVALLNQILPKNWQQQLPSEGLNTLMTMLGTPEAQTEAQKILGAVTQGMAGAWALSGTAGTVAPVLTGSAKGSAQALAAQPNQQIVGGGTAVLGGVAGQSAGQELAKSVDGDQNAQNVAGTVGNVLGSLAGGVAGAGATPTYGVTVKGVPGKPSTVESAIPEPKPSTMAEAENTGELVKKATSFGPGQARAQQVLASSTNPEAMAAAERLGVSLPADVFSDDAQVQAVIGMARSQVGSTAETGWKQAYRDAVAQMDEVQKQNDALFIEGRPSVGVASQRVKDSLATTRNDLEKLSKQFYDDVDAQVPKETKASMDNLKSTLEKIKSEVGQDGMTGEELKMLKMASDPEATYGRLAREKSYIGAALRRKASPYGSMDEATLSRLYSALAEDQRGTVQSVGGPELLDKLVKADSLYKESRGIGKQIVDVFGKDLEGGIGKKLQSALSGASSTGQENKDLNKLISVIPEDLRKQTLATGIASIARNKNGDFDPIAYTKLYGGLRANPEMYNEIAKAMGPEGHKAMLDLYVVSKRIADASKNILYTGKANQAILKGMGEDGLLSKVINNPVGRAVTSMAGTAMGGRVGEAGATMVTNLATSNSKSRLEAVGKLFNSDKFQKMAVDAATKDTVDMATVNGVANDKAFIEYAKTAGLKDFLDRQKWLLSALGLQSQSNSDRDRASQKEKK